MSINKKVDSRIDTAKKNYEDLELELSNINTKITPLTTRADQINMMFLYNKLDYEDQKKLRTEFKELDEQKNDMLSIYNEIYAKELEALKVLEDIQELITKNRDIKKKVLRNKDSVYDQAEQLREKAKQLIKQADELEKEWQYSLDDISSFLVELCGSSEV